ncbi:MAG: PIN domain-containing protein [Micrococcales bacterium]|nr:PIN domain-containing protein [Micrococcales bacterium]MCL2668752.1 PIN domain-containing protein [Micrococcales bacterium]
MAFPVFLDTCTIFGAALNDLLLTLAERNTYRPLWSADVLTELRRNLVKYGIDEEAVDHRIAAMGDAFPDAEVTGYADLVAQMTCHDKDRHVLAAAVRGGAAIIVTFNLADFPDSALAPYKIAVVHPDDFLLDQLDLFPAVVADAVGDIAAAYERPPMTPQEYLTLVTRCGAPRFARAVAVLL